VRSLDKTWALTNKWILYKVQLLIKNKYILVFIDHLIKMKHLVLIIFMKVEEVINCFYAHVWKHHDLLKFFISDQDIQFIFNVWKHICKMLKIDIKLLITYHFEINVIMKHYLWIFINYMQNDWVKWLSEVEFVINNISSLITLASFFLINSSQNSHLNFKYSESLLKNFMF